MFLSCNTGTVECLTFLEYKKRIEKCVNYSSGNEIWCSIDGKPESYPCLSILIKGNEAVVSYFSDGNLEMFVSVGDITKDGTVEFENGQYDVAAYQIITIEKAVECALHFFHSQKKPSCIKWEEL